MDSVLEASKCFGTREVKNGKETKGGETKRTKVKAFVAKKAVKVSASLIPRKEKGLMISAIDEVGDHESEAEKNSGKKKVRISQNQKLRWLTLEKFLLNE